MGEAPKTPTAPARSPANRAIFVILGVIAVAILAVVFILYRPTFPGMENERSDNYVILFKNLELTDAAAVVESLKSQGVKDYKLEDDGRTILIPKKKKSEIALKIAGEGLMPTGGTVGFEIFDKGGALGATDFDKQIKFSRAISGELSRSIARIYGVEEARVQVVIPATQLFSTVKNPVQASVFLKIREGELLSPMQVAGIISLVASSVEDLKREYVTVVDYYGRVLSSDEYKKDYDRLLALLLAQKEENRKNKKAFNPLASTDELETKTSETSSDGGFSFFDVYKKIDMEKKTRQEKDLLRSLGLQKEMSTQDLFAAKIKFKEKYEQMLESNIKVISEQFFPKKSVAVKVNVELNNLRISESVTPNSLISRITTMILLDENNKEIKLTPEIREALMKGVAAAIGYIKGRDKIDLRWAPMSSVQQKSWIPAKAESKVNVNPQKVKTTGTPSSVENFNFNQLAGIQLPENTWYYVGGAGVLFILLFFWRNRRPLIAEPAQDKTQNQVFEDAANTQGFEDLKVPPLEQFRDIANRSPEKVASVLEKWFQEDEA